MKVSIGSEIVEILEDKQKPYYNTYYYTIGYKQTGRYRGAILLNDAFLSTFGRVYPFQICYKPSLFLSFTYRRTDSVQRLNCTQTDIMLLLYPLDIEELYSSIFHNYFIIHREFSTRIFYIRIGTGTIILKRSRKRHF